MEQPICVDTTLLVGLLRNDPIAKAWFAEHQKTDIIVTTPINAFEVFHGAHLSAKRDENVQSAEDLLSEMSIINLSLGVAKKAGACFAALQKQGESVDIRDLLIGATALAHGCSLKTANKKHFERIPGLVLVD